jgi:hypothetical protein
MADEIGYAQSCISQSERRSIVRQGPISGAGLQVPQHHGGVESADTLQVDIDFPSTPDDVRLRSMTMNRFATAGCGSGLLGLASMILGLAGLAGATYICLEADTRPDTSIDLHNRRWMGYAVGGSMGFVSSTAVTFGLSQVYLAMKKRRRAAQEIVEMSVRARFQNATTEGFRREPA